MKTSLLLTALAALLAFSAAAKDKNATATNLPPDQVEANYTKAIEGRTADILKILALTDTNQSAKVHDSLIAQYRALNAWHNVNDAKLKAAKADTNAATQIRVSLKAQHEKFLGALAENLSPAQIEQVKDKMTYGKVQFTYKGYMNEYPDLTEPHQAEVLRLLKEAREEAMDGGSSDEKSAIFNRYKGKINNYLSKQGVHPKKKSNSSSPEANPPAK